jgi:hypothetical protein
VRERTAGAVVTALSVVAVALAATAGASTAAPFRPPVLLTPTGAGGYEPAVISDRYGNLFATAHKENWQNAVAPDTGSPTLSRAMSWTWMSSDGGRSWQNLPGLAQDKVVGDEGDFAVDAAGHLYFADLSFADSSLTRWTVTGLGKVTWDFTRPAIPTAGIDDRPWLAAHGNGIVLYVGEVLQAGEAASDADPGTTIYRSTDGGQHFEQGARLPGTTYCKPATDRTGRHPFFVVMCTGTGREILAFTSADDGRSFRRTVVGHYTGYGSRWPTADIASDGSVVAVAADDDKQRLLLMQSHDQGRTFSTAYLPLPRWHYDLSVAAVAPDARAIGIGTYARRTSSEPWRIYGAVWRPPARPELVELDAAHPVAPPRAPGAPHDLMGAAFDASGRFTVVWTREGTRVGTDPAVQTLRQVFSASTR